MVCVYPFTHYPMCSIKISCNLLNFPLLCTDHNKTRKKEPFWLSHSLITLSLFFFFFSFFVHKYILFRASRYMCLQVATSFTNIDAQKLMRYILILHAFWRGRPSFFCECTLYIILFISICVYIFFCFHIFLFIRHNTYLIILG